MINCYIILIFYLPLQFKAMRTREAMLWELEEKHIHEKHQLSKRHVKELCFMQRHQMIIRHEKELDQIKKYDDKILCISSRFLAVY